MFNNKVKELRSKNKQQETLINSLQKEIELFKLQIKKDKANNREQEFIKTIKDLEKKISKLESEQKEYNKQEFVLENMDLKNKIEVLEKEAEIKEKEAELHLREALIANSLDIQRKEKDIEFQLINAKADLKHSEDELASEREKFETKKLDLYAEAKREAALEVKEELYKTNGKMFDLMEKFITAPKSDSVVNIHGK